MMLLLADASSLPAWASLLLPALAAVVGVAVVWGAMRKSIERLEEDLGKVAGQIGDVKNQIGEFREMAVELKITSSHTDRTARRLHERVDELDEKQRRIDRNMAVMLAREEITDRIHLPPVPGPIRPRIEPSPPPHTRKKDPDDSGGTES